jgi:hypothetical protein
MNGDIFLLSPTTGAMRENEIVQRLTFSLMYINDDDDDDDDGKEERSLQQEEKFSHSVCKASE